jgi:hypothetical protein
MGRRQVKREQEKPAEIDVTNVASVLEPYESNATATASWLEMVATA